MDDFDIDVVVEPERARPVRLELAAAFLCAAGALVWASLPAPDWGAGLKGEAPGALACSRTQRAASPGSPALGARGAALDSERGPGSNGGAPGVLACSRTQRAASPGSFALGAREAALDSQRGPGSKGGAPVAFACSRTQWAASPGSPALSAREAPLLPPAVFPPAVLPPGVVAPAVARARRVPRWSRRQALAARGAFLHVLDRVGATEPFVAEKAAARVNAPRDEALDDVLQRASIGRVMRERASSFRSCYERAAKRDPDLRETLLVTFTIEKRGSVSAAHVVARQRRGSSPLARCVRDVVRRASFPAGAQRFTVSHTLVFRPRA